MNIEELTRGTLDSLKNAVSAETVVGKPVYADDALIIPISKVTFGFVTGGGQYSESTPKVLDTLPYANASGGGASVQPIGFLVMKGGKVDYIGVDRAEEGKWGELLRAGISLLKN